MRDIDDLRREELADIVGQIKSVLFKNAEGDWDRDNPWECETVEHVAGVLRDAGLVPKERE